MTVDPICMGDDLRNRENVAVKGLRRAGRGLVTIFYA